MSTIHDTHCSHCFSLNCISTDCPVSKCKHCHTLLHSCKQEEHIEHVCRRAPVKCPNYSNGCNVVLLREKITNHLPICAASIVVCSRDRCRKLNAKSCKLELKFMGRKKQNLPVNERDDIDIQLAIYDQNLIIESYNSSRPKRVRQRDPLHPAHPLLPLRNMPYDSSSPTEGFEDSSEDEMREKREKLKKSKLVFSNCYMCQIDPAAQHLHTLGNGVDIEKMKKRRMTPQVVDKFHEKLGLKVNVDVLNVSESSLKSENIREIQKGGTLYTLKCLKTVRRSEYGVHCLSQHTETIDIMNDIVLRCPNWSSGCDFTSTRVKVKVGNLKFHPHTSTITHQPTADQFPESPDSVSYHNIETLPLWVYETLADYLPSSALFNLSLVNRTLRKVVFIAMNSKCYVEPVWEMERQGKWALKQYIWKVTSTEPPPETEWRVPVELNNHISQCQYFNPVSYEEKMVPVFSREFEKKSGTDSQTNYPSD